MKKRLYSILAYAGRCAAFVLGVLALVALFPAAGHPAWVAGVPLMLGFGIVVKNWHPTDIGYAPWLTQNLADIITGILNRTFTAGGLVQGFAQSATQYFKTANTLTYCINGKLYAKTTADNQPFNGGAILKSGLTVNAGGSGYSVGDTFNIVLSPGTNGVGIVTEVAPMINGVAGVVLNVAVLYAGQLYVPGIATTTTYTTGAYQGTSGTGLTVNITGATSFLQQPKSTFCNYLITLDAAGAFCTIQGAFETAQTFNLPFVPAGQCPIGVVSLATDTTHTFTSGTTAGIHSISGVTDTYWDLSSAVQSNVAV